MTRDFNVSGDYEAVTSETFIVKHTKWVEFKRMAWLGNININYWKLDFIVHNLLRNGFAI